MFRKTQWVRGEVYEDVHDQSRGLLLHECFKYWERMRNRARRNLDNGVIGLVWVGRWLYLV